MSLERVRLLLLEASEDATAWSTALWALAEACGGRVGQLVARDSQDRLLLHVLANVDPGMTDIAEAHGMGDLARNPRLRIGHRAPVMSVIAEQDLVSDDVRRRHPIYADLFEQQDWTFNAQAVLHRDDDVLVRTSVSRTRTQGSWRSQDLRVFAALLPHVQSAVRRQILAERRAVDGLLAAADVAGDVLLVLNRLGWLIGASSQADRLLASGKRLASRRRGVRASSVSEDAKLQAAINGALAAWGGGVFPPATSIALMAGERDPALLLRVVALPPKPFALTAEPAVLIHGGVGSELSSDALRQAFRLSAAEIEIVRSLKTGLAPAEIAQRRGVSVGTVRVQLKSIFRKMGVRRQSELLARVAV